MWGLLLNWGVSRGVAAALGPRALPSIPGEGFQLEKALGTLLLLPPRPSLPGGGWVCFLGAAGPKFKCAESFEWRQSHPFTRSSFFVGHGLVVLGHTRLFEATNSHSWPRAGLGLLRTESLPVSPPSASLCPPCWHPVIFLGIGMSWPKGWHGDTNPGSRGAAGRPSAHPVPWHAAAVCPPTPACTGDTCLACPLLPISTPLGCPWLCHCQDSGSR